ncbi:hypothetical protein [Bacillus salacetis]|uniref:hypothetical protein n=1 Tax=Bacillus salacetis TaxID=2315464 RepID=UPI001F0BA527|nr:hypothetical protein [Bacillus salacetis]
MSYILAIIIIFSLLLMIITPARIFVVLISLSLLAFPVSIISMFSQEPLLKRLFALFGNLLPAGLFFYAVLMDFIDEFFRSAP